MNRSIALFVALALLLAHTLAIYNDGTGSLAFPYDQSHAAYRLARNLVLEGQLQWNTGTTAFESYSSPLWIALCTVGERICATRFNANLELLSINLYCQTIGIVAMLATVVLTARLRVDRVASLIAPLILVSSGCIAAAAANGMETALFTLFAVGCFLAFERGRPNWLAAFAVLLVATRAEGVLLVASLLALRPTAGPAVREGAPVPRRAWPLALAVLAFAGACVLRWSTTDFVLPPAMHAVVDPAPGQVASGIASLGDLARTCPAVLLCALPLVLLPLRKLSGTGVRALVLGSVWLAWVALQGRAPLPFCELAVPALPFLGIAIQEGLIAALDSGSRLWRRLGLTALAGALVASALPSRLPADIGPLPFERLQQAWLRPEASARFGYEQRLGRAGLDEEIENVHLLRGVGRFFRDRLDPKVSVLSPWPGAIGYLWRGTLYDALPRANPIGGVDRPAPWSRRTRVDVAAVLASEVGFDFVVPVLRVPTGLPTPATLAALWRVELDQAPDAPGRAEAIEREFARFELVTVPIAVDSRAGAREDDVHFLLLRNRALGLAPQVELQADDGALRVRVRHVTHHQLADLRVTFTDERGRTLWMRPTGELTEHGPVSARTELLLYDTGTRYVDALEAPLPTAWDGVRLVSVRAGLVNPDATQDHPYAAVSAEASASL
jgi:hypothetical protein